jgi:lysophospholipase L1-like esterase
MRIGRAVTTVITASALLATPTGVAAAPAVPAVRSDPATELPTSIASLGDSITRGFNACGFYVDCTRRSWSTGDDEDVRSHRHRLLDFGVELTRQANLARSGARSDALAGQAAAAVAMRAQYVTIEIGANDACARSEAAMTSVEDYRRNIRAGLAVLREGVPQARVFVASVPDLRRVWAVGRGAWYIRKAWDKLDVCPSMLARSESVDAADVRRRDRVRVRTILYNEVLAQECAAYGPRCWYDQQAVFRYPFTRKLLSKWDFFHPNAAGQRRLAYITWQSGFFRDDLT